LEHPGRPGLARRLDSESSAGGSSSPTSYPLATEAPAPGTRRLGPKKRPERKKRSLERGESERPPTTANSPGSLLRIVATDVGVMLCGVLSPQSQGSPTSALCPPP